MEAGYMAWWYWFGMWIFGITSLVLTWWLFLDAVRRNGLTARFIWPALTALGVLAQIPAFFFMGKANAAAADVAAMLGIFGFVIALIGAVTYFSKGATRSGGSGWTMTTRNESVDPSRIRSGGPKPSVPVGVQPPVAPGAKDPRERTRPGASGAPANRIPGQTAGHHTPRREATPPPGAAAAKVSSPIQTAGEPGRHNDPAPTETDATIVDGNLPSEYINPDVSGNDQNAVAVNDSALTVLDEAAPTVTDNTTLGEDATATILDDSLTVVTDDETLGEDGTATVLDDNLTMLEDAEPEPTATVLDEPVPTATVLEDAAMTVLDEPAPTVGEDAASTIIEDAALKLADTESALTIIDDVAPTATDESATIAEDSGARFAPEIVLTDGVARRVIITDRDGSFIVGRDPEKANLAVDDPRASRGHFSITYTDGHYYLNDLGSSNGTFVNGAQARGPVRLFPGDSIEFGRTTAQFRIS